MNDKTYYLTTPLYYVNAKPHIGHAYTNILCDTFARWQKFTGRNVFFLTGTDEHGTKIEKIAKAEGKAPRDFVNQMVPEFVKLWEILGIDYDYFIRTTDENHKRVVAEVLSNLEKSGEIYKAVYKGWYCTPCESFWTDLQLKEGKCPDCGRDVQELSEENYFFRLAKHQDWLQKEIESDRLLVRPDYRKNEILGFLRQPLEDLSITRPRARLGWGIDYPNSPEHVVYVWFDALINYVSATRDPKLDKKYIKNLWPADLHLVGKDILRQHAVYWPIMLKAMGLEMPRLVLAHGWWTMQGAKVSKSRGNAVDPIELVKKYGVDAFRYFLLHEVTLGQDGAFSEDLLAQRYTTDLANDLGNLWFRIVTMLEKYFEGKVPVPAPEDFNQDLLKRAFDLLPKTMEAMESHDPRQALDIIFDVIRRANQFVEEKKPWVLAKDPAKKPELATTLFVLVESVAHAACLLQAFIPQTAAKLIERLDIHDKASIHTAEAFSKPFVSPERVIERGDALFPRLDEPEKENAAAKK